MHPIWHSLEITLDSLETGTKNTMGEVLGIDFTEIGPDFLRARMPVDHRTVQPAGLLHGGASASLAETLGSVASYLVIDPEKQDCVGIEINANHIRGVRNGFVHGIARPLHLGKTLHVWDIRISDDQDQTICVSRLTVAILERRSS